MNNPALPRETLVAVQKGNLNAFEQLLSTYERRMYQYFYHATRSADEAADLTQELFIKVYKNRRKIDPDRGFHAWLYKIAYRLFIDWLRKAHKKYEFSLETEELETITSPDTYIQVEAGMDVNQALSGLKPEYRLALNLFYTHGFQYEEIAEQMNVPLNTVKTWIYRAKQEIKLSLKDNYDQPTNK